MGKLSLTMIVKDDAGLLVRALESARPFVDEICIVDTGSTDGTRELAESCADRFAHQPFDDDFASVRNRCLLLATGDWILVLDADEQVFAASRDLRQALDRPGVLAYELAIRNALGGGRFGVHRAHRLFRRRDDLRFQGRIHEHVGADLQRIAREESSWRVETLGSVRIEHHGYDPQVKDQRAKRERNLRLLQRAIQEDPADPYLIYKLSRELAPSEAAEWKLLESAMLLLAESETLRRRRPWAAEALSVAAMAWARSGEAELAREAAREALAAEPDHPVARYALACAQRSAGRLEEARLLLRQVLFLPRPSRGFHYDDESHDLRVRLYLAEVLFELGDTDGGLQVLENALRRHDDRPEPRVALVEALVAAGRAQEGLRRGLDWLREEAAGPSLLAACAQAADQLGLTGEARALGARGPPAEAPRCARPRARGWWAPGTAGRR
ncbi:MAG: glycosyltransferase, partial [Acidobacteriota bacterium]